MFCPVKPREYEQEGSLNEHVNILKLKQTVSLTSSLHFLTAPWLPLTVLNCVLVIV